MIYKDVSGLIGKTPMLELSRFAAARGLTARVCAKLEYFNPAGSVKDRTALFMINDAEKQGLLPPGGTIIEPTSGNTGIGLACIAASRGYRVILVMPDTMSIERRKLLAAYGAEIVLTKGIEGMKGALEKAAELASQIPGGYVPGQFSNTKNPEAHLLTTGPEIWEDAAGEVDIFVACVGTGGTVTGVGKYLKSKKENVRVVAVEPAESPLLSEGRTGTHKIQGIGANFVPDVLDRGVYDEVIAVADEEAFAAVRETARLEGLLVGISSGAALEAAARLARRAGNENKLIVALCPDSGERYLSVL